MAHQMAQEGALKSIIVLPILKMVGAFKNTLAQQKLDLSQFGAS